MMVMTMTMMVVMAMVMVLCIGYERMKGKVKPLMCSMQNLQMVKVAVSVECITTICMYRIMV